MFIGISGKRPDVFNRKSNEEKLIIILYPKQPPENIYWCTLMISVPGQPALVILKKQTCVVLNVSVKLDQSVSNGCHLGHYGKIF